jgi:cyclic pyranopterin phosphate synthase
LAMTTNGSLLARHAEALRRAGVNRINISLDTLDRAQFVRMTGSDALADVLSGVEAALAAGFERVKINSVVIRGVNEEQIVPLAELAAERSLQVRFIEYMPVERPGGPGGATVPAAEMRAVLERRFGALEPLAGDGVASMFKVADHVGTIGLIAPVTERFCECCNRLRLTADGHLKPCLLSDTEYNLRSLLRSGASDAELLDLINHLLASRPKHHRIMPGSSGGSPGLEGMRRIGG